MVKLGFQNFYLYTAACPITGENFSLILPKTNTDCMNLFLAALAEEYKDTKLTIIMDGAGWHKSIALQIPKNIHVIYLPPYSPELNPIERLWLYIKKAVIRNKIYESIEELESALVAFLNSISLRTISQICATNYMFI